MTTSDKTKAELVRENTMLKLEINRLKIQLDKKANSITGLIYNLITKTKA